MKITIKNSLFVGVILFISSFKLINPPVEGSGIFMNEKDFIKGKLSLQVDCKSEKHKIKRNEFLNKPYIDVIHDGKNYKYQKSEIFGYQDCDGLVYKFVDKAEYRIMESKLITLYEVELPNFDQYERGPISEKKYYFSKTPASETIPLTVSNLKKSYPTNKKFLDNLSTYIKGDNELTSYDTLGKMYTINKLLMEEK